MIKIYLSHKISGGDLSTPVENMEKNCAEARRVGDIISRELNRVIATEVYIPGGPTEEFVRRAWQQGYLSVEQILDIDCDIIVDQHFILCYVPEGDELNGGRRVEVDHAISHSKPWYVFSDPKFAIDYLKAYFSREINRSDDLNQEVNYNV